MTRMVVPQLLLMTLAGALTLPQKQRTKNRSPPQNEHVIKIRELLVCLVLGIRRCQEYVGQHDEDYEKNQGGDQRWGDGMVADVLIKLFHRRHTIAYRMWLVDGGHGVRWWR